MLLGLLSLAALEGFQLLSACFLLISRFPFRVGHPVDGFEGLIVVTVDVEIFRCRGIPFGETVATEIRGQHEFDVLNVSVRLQVFDQTSKSGGFELGFEVLIHGY